MPRKPRANMPSHTSKQCISIKRPSGDPKSARKRVTNPRNISTIMPAPETLQELPRQEAAEDAAQRDNQRCTHHDSVNQNINPSRPAGPTRGRLQWRKKDNETRHRREVKPRSAVRQEIIRVEKGYLKVVDNLELTDSPRTRGIDDKLLSKTTCAERNAAPS